MRGTVWMPKRPGIGSRGDALELLIYDPSGAQLQRVIVDAAERGEPMHVVPAGCWQAARFARRLQPGGLHGIAGFRVGRFRAARRGLAAGDAPGHAASTLNTEDEDGRTLP